MTTILRLQGLNLKAGTEDIRTFFKSLHIPTGGVYIVGGSLAEAFIAFTTEKEAQLAMRFSGNFLKGSQVTLHISSMDELEHKLKSVLKKKKPSPTQHNARNHRPSEDADVQPLNARPATNSTASLPLTSEKTSPSTAAKLDPRTAKHRHSANTSNFQPSSELDSGTAFLLGVCTVLHGLQSNQRENKEPVPGADFPNTSDRVVYNEQKPPEQALNSKPGYVRLFGLPASTTKEVICNFFGGLKVQEAIVNVKLGLGHGCLVKFASEKEASDALLYNQRFLGSLCVEVRTATEKMWMSVLEECDSASDVCMRAKPKQIPLRETINHKRMSPPPLLKKRSVKGLPSVLPKKPRTDVESTTASTPAVEYIVMVCNLPKTMTKTEIKELLGCPNAAHKNVQHLLDKEGNRTDTAFLIFDCAEDYEYALNLNGCHVGSDTIEVSSVTKTAMRDMMIRVHPRYRHQNEKPNGKMKRHPWNTTTEEPVDTEAPTCLFVRNLPGDVQKSQIRSFFNTFKLENINIDLLLDSDGRGIGEAVVQFRSPKLAAQAQRLHGRDFLGTQVLLTRISVTQMEDILSRHVTLK
ncbi:uncharacterized protein V6R79_024773 [Siganus canaliculatus]